MSSLNHFLELGTIVVTILSIIVTILVIGLMVKKRDVEYRERYEDFQRQKQRVEENLRKARQTQTGV